ncbi:hypothetical protein B0H14DRAFT_3464884 [Mycena olivaceomarginata]|nr:hypothetical protein B0H14DRAFT_3464884 [Mycena olivaceomarginata]
MERRVRTARAGMGIGRDESCALDENLEAGMGAEGKALPTKQLHAAPLPPLTAPSPRLTNTRSTTAHTPSPTSRTYDGSALSVVGPTHGGPGLHPPKQRKQPPGSRRWLTDSGPEGVLGVVGAASVFACASPAATSISPTFRSTSSSRTRNASTIPRSSAASASCARTAAPRARPALLRVRLALLLLLPPCRPHPRLQPQLPPLRPRARHRGLILQIQSQTHSSPPPPASAPQPQTAAPHPAAQAPTSSCSPPPRRPPPTQCTPPLLVRCACGAGACPCAEAEAGCAGSGRPPVGCCFSFSPVDCGCDPALLCRHAPPVWLGVIGCPVATSVLACQQLLHPCTVPSAAWGYAGAGARTVAPRSTPRPHRPGARAAPSLGPGPGPVPDAHTRAPSPHRIPLVLRVAPPASESHSPPPRNPLPRSRSLSGDPLSLPLLSNERTIPFTRPFLNRPVATGSGSGSARRRRGRRGTRTARRTGTAAHANSSLLRT